MVTRTLPNGLFKRGNMCDVRYSIPTKFQAIVEKKQTVRSAGTKNLAVALTDHKEKGGMRALVSDM